MKRPRASRVPRAPVAASVGVDTGGTFTDFVALRGGRLVALKLRSTPREPEGAVLARSQAVQFQLAHLATETEAARLLVYRCAHMKDNKIPYSRESAMAKFYASETASRNGMACVQLMGPAGLTRKYAVERLTRDAKLAEIGEGTSEIQKLVISRQLGLG